MSKDCNVVRSLLEKFCNLLFSRESSKGNSEPDIQHINSFPITTGGEFFLIRKLRIRNFEARNKGA